MKQPGRCARSGSEGSGLAPSLLGRMRLPCSHAVLPFGVAAAAGGERDSIIHRVKWREATAGFWGSSRDRIASRIRDRLESAVDRGEGERDCLAVKYRWGSELT